MMINLIRGEHIKQRKDHFIVGLSISILFILIFMIIWSTCLTDGESHQELLKQSDKAGFYGLFFFTAVLRRIYGLIYGYHVIDMELINNRQDFFIQNTGRMKMITGKIIYGIGVLFIISCLSFILPFITSLIIFHNYSFSFLVFNQIILVWLMAIGSMLLGMLLRFIFNEFLLFTIIITLLEFFSSFFPHFIIDYWTKCDGFYYLSQGLIPLKNQLRNLKNYQIYLPDSYNLITGISLWVIILTLMTLVIIYIIKRKEIRK